MASKTEICNQALGHLGVSREIGNVETENSEEAAACRRFYPIALEMILTAFPWPFAGKFAALGLVAASPAEAPEWAYSYRYPSDALELRRIVSATRRDTKASRVPYKIMQDATGQLIYTDWQNASIEYTARTDRPELYKAAFQLALSLLLASLIAPRVTGGDPFKLGDRALARYPMALSRAQMDALGEEQPDDVIDGDLVSSRFDSDPRPPTQP
jgi:hypothetical protein